MNLDQILEQKKKDKERRKRENEKKREALKVIEDRKIKLRDKFLKKPRLYFYYERIQSETSQPDPRNVRTLLSKLMINRYKGEPLSKILLSTELYVKGIGGRKINYKVINSEWEEGIETRTMKDINFTEKMFTWMKSEEPEAYDSIDCD